MWRSDANIQYLDSVMQQGLFIGDRLGYVLTYIEYRYTL